MISLKRLDGWLKDNVVTFHQKRAASLNDLTLSDLLDSKNPYLYCAKGADSLRALVESMLDAHLSSQEETFFGNFLSDLAQEVCISCLDGHESRFEGIDLEFDRDGVHYLVVVKSGPKWGNHRSLAKLKTDFEQAVATLKQDGGADYRLDCVNGICYAQVPASRKKLGYRKLSGQEFWEFLSDDPDFYLRIVDSLQHQSTIARGLFGVQRRETIGRFTRELGDRFRSESGEINWRALVQFNSGKKGK